jgi:acetylornithine deacetylase/succinyl-diaminopimelate desuccinylase-like protein
MTNNRTAALEYARQNQQRFLTELKDFASIPSISTDPSCKPEMQQAAEWVARQMESLGMEQVKIYPTAGHPVVFGQFMQARPIGADSRPAPTVLVYGHYDVQPAEPLELWESPAFEPVQRGENLYARGASDMKGQVMVALKAIEAIVNTGELPVNIKMMVEGEEEIGSPNLEAFIAQHKELLAADFALNLDSSMIREDLPTITYGLRGLAYFELRVSGPDHDLHSGSFGGVVHNPAQALCELIAGMHDAQGRVTLPGYYDRVRPLEAEEREELARLPLDEDFYLKQTGAPALYGEEGYTHSERIGARPTLEVNGLLSGFTGEGSKTVLPAKAMAKISMRLVPDQDPEEVHQQLIRYLEMHAPPTIRWEVIRHAGGPASVTNRDLPGVQALSQALDAVWGRRPVFKREGGSVPVVAQMEDILGIGSIVVGFGLPDDNLHAPNEKIHLPTWYRGIETVIHFIDNLKGSDD